MYQNVVQQNATCCLLWWVFEYMALGSTFMHVAATHGFLLHLIKVTCWEEPNHDSKQRIRSTVKTSQVSSMSGSVGERDESNLFHFLLSWGSESKDVPTLSYHIIIIQDHTESYTCQKWRQHVRQLGRLGMQNSDVTGPKSPRQRR